MIQVVFYSENDMLLWLMMHIPAEELRAYQLKEIAAKLKDAIVEKSKEPVG